MRRLSLLMVLIFSLSACDIFNIGQGILAPSELEISQAIKEALSVSIRNAVSRSSRENGFYNNPNIKIPFPPEAERAAKTLRDLGMGMIVDQFVETMNHGAEEAAEKATPIFHEAIVNMSIADVYGIWRGSEDAATQYLRRNTMSKLRRAFKPEIDRSLSSVGITKYWDPVVSNYNKIPFVTPIETDLSEYVLGKTLDGLFQLMADEEAKIRQDPAARTTYLLERVFGYQEPA